MSRWSAFWVLCLILVSCLSVTPAEAARHKQGALAAEHPPVPEIERFQLFQAEYTTFDLKRKETYTHQGVFLLDTVTGKVKRYINKIDENGIYIETWVPTELLSQEQNKINSKPEKEVKK